MIPPVKVVLSRTVADSDWCFDNLCGSHLQSQSELYHVSWWYYTMVIDLIGQLCRDVIGRLSVKPWCYDSCHMLCHWCVQFDPSVVTVKQSLIVSRIVSCPCSRSLVVSFTWSRQEVVCTVPVVVTDSSQILVCINIKLVNHRFSGFQVELFLSFL